MEPGDLSKRFRTSSSVHTAAVVAGDVASSLSVGGSKMQYRMLCRQWAISALRPNWSSEIHGQHCLYVIKPHLIFCGLCGRYAGSRQHLRDLPQVCNGEPGLGSTWKARRRHMLAGRHPTSGSDLGSLPMLVRPRLRCLSALAAAAMPGHPLRAFHWC